MIEQEERPLKKWVALMILHGNSSANLDFNFLHQHNAWTGSADAIREEFARQEAEPLVVTVSKEVTDE